MKAEIGRNEVSSPGSRWMATPRAGARSHGADPATMLRRSTAGPLQTRPRIAIRVAHRYEDSPRRVFSAWLDPAVAGKWLFATASQPIAHVEIDGRVGGAFRFVDRHAGKTTTYAGQYREIVADRRLVFTLLMEPHPVVITRVTIAIAPIVKGCVLTLTHDNVPGRHASHVEGRWAGILYGLGQVLGSVSVTFHDCED
jgi:uncharacterized protein YndB with AHSA1/START domain